MMEFIELTNISTAPFKLLPKILMTKLKKLLLQLKKIKN